MNGRPVTGYEFARELAANLAASQPTVIPDDRLAKLNPFLLENIAGADSVSPNSTVGFSGRSIPDPRVKIVGQFASNALPLADTLIALPLENEQTV